MQYAAWFNVNSKASFNLWVFIASTSSRCFYLVVACITNYRVRLTNNNILVNLGPLCRRLKKKIAYSKQLMT